MSAKPASKLCSELQSIDSDPAVVANKVDLCSASPPELPSIAFGQAVSTDLSESAPSPSPASPSDRQLQPRAVSANEGALYAKEHGLLYVETSAKEGWGVVDAFEWTAREALRRHNEDELQRRKVGLSSGCTIPHADYSLGASIWTVKRQEGVAARKVRGIRQICKYNQKMPCCTAEPCLCLANLTSGTMGRDGSSDL